MSGRSFKQTKHGFFPLLVLLLCTLLLCTRHAAALTYYFIDGSPLCFVESIDEVKNTQVSGVYNWVANPAYPAAKVQLALTATDRSGSVYYSKALLEDEHSFVIVLPQGTVAGEQTLCFIPSSKFIATEENPLKLRVYLDQAPSSKANGDQAIVENIRKRRQVDGMDVFTYRDAGGQLKDVLQPHVYLEKVDKALASMESALDALVSNLDRSVGKESRMRETSESTFTRVWICALLLISVISGVLWVEFSFLKSTLRKKKLV